MVLIDDEDSIYAFDRNNNVFKISCIIFPHKKEFRHIRNTLLDCEMIIEKVQFRVYFRINLLKPVVCGDLHYDKIDNIRNSMA